MIEDFPFDLHVPQVRRFSMGILLVFPFIVLAFVPKVKYFIPYRYVGIVICIMLLAAVFNLFNHRQDVVARCFWLGSISLVLYKFLVVFLRSVSGVDLNASVSTSVAIDLILSFSPMLLFHYCYVNGRKRELFLCVALIFLCLTYGAWSSIRAEDTGMGRVLAMGTANMDINMLYDRAEAIMLGTLGYGLTYGAVVVLTALLHQLGAFRKILWPFLFVEIGVLAFGVYRAAFTIALFQMTLSMVLIVLSRCVPYKLFKHIAITGCIIVAIATSFPSVFSFLKEPLYAMAEVVETPEYQMRIKSIADTISGDEKSYAWERTELYRISWRTFLNYPIFGCALHHWVSGGHSDATLSDGDLIGGHSFIFDGLGLSGIVGFSICIFGVWRLIKYLFMLFDRYGDGEISKKGWLCCFLPHAVVAIINTTGSPEIITALFLVAPAIFLMFPRRRNQPVVWHRRGYGMP